MKRESKVLRSQIDKLDIHFTYKIIVKNEGEIKESAILADQIPERLYFVEEDNENYWKKTDGGVIATIEDLDIGEVRELSLVLRWQNGKDNFGDSINIARIVNSSNEAQYPDENPSNDISTAEVVISLITGKDIAITIAGYMSIAISIGIGIVVIAKKKK